MLVASSYIYKLKFNIFFKFVCASDYPDQARFSWSLYLEETGSKAVPAEVFKVVSAADEHTAWMWIHVLLLEHLHADA